MMKKLNKSLLKCFCLCLFVTGTSLPLFIARAGTFVGNGGNAGDVELLVTQKQVLGAWESLLSENSNERLCTCKKAFENNMICEALVDLNDQQVKYCQSFLKKMATQIVKTHLQANDIQWNWTHDNISVASGNSLRGADAVTNFQEKSITINLKRFLALSPSKRVYLLAHELLHLGKWEDHPLGDDGPMGPFSGKAGARKLLNAAGAATVMVADDEGLFWIYGSKLRRPQGWRKNWINLSFGSVNSEAKNSFENDQFDLVNGSYNHYFGSLGVEAGYQKQQADHQVYSSIDTSETLEVMYLGFNYRWFPFNDPLTYWGQSYLSLGLGAEHLQSKFEISDQITSSESSANSLGLSLQGKYYIPLFFKFWAFANVSASFHHYKHPDFGVDYESPRTAVSLGVSYGF